LGISSFSVKKWGTLEIKTKLFFQALKMQLKKNYSVPYTRIYNNWNPLKENEVNKPHKRALTYCNQSISRKVLTSLYEK